MKNKIFSSPLCRVASVALALNLITINANAVDCYTDCGAVARVSYPCPTFRNPHRRCDGRDPAVFGACETAKEAECRVLQPLENEIIHQMVSEVSDDSRVQSAAQGWTTATCAASAVGLVTAVNAGYSTPICAAMNVAAAGCVTFVVASGGLITSGVCSQLCADHRLGDCR